MPCPQNKQQIQRLANNILYTLNSINKKSHINPVIVYDIDDTLIDSQGRPIEPIIRTYWHAKNLGFKTVIITAREDRHIEPTKQQLHSHGIVNYSGLYFRPSLVTDLATYKLSARKNIHERGSTVVMSIGDMPFDIGKYGGIGFLVPKCSCTRML